VSLNHSYESRGLEKRRKEKRHDTVRLIWKLSSTTFSGMAQWCEPKKGVTIKKGQKVSGRLNHRTWGAGRKQFGNDEWPNLVGLLPVRNGGGETFFWGGGFGRAVSKGIHNETWKKGRVLRKKIEATPFG